MDQTQTYAENQTVVGYFNDQDRAERGLDELRDAGFTSAHLGVAHRGFSSTGSATSKTKHAAEGMWDKVKNFFEGGSAEPYADERTRGDMSTREVTDPSAAYDSSYSYSNDDIHHSLTGMSVPEYRSRYFSHKFGTNQKGAIVTVNAGERFADAERILRDNGADLGDTASETADDTPDYAAAGVPNRDLSDTNRRYYADQPGRTEDVQNIQILGEVLRVHRERVNRGEVVVRKNVVSENQTVQVPVTREEFVLERHPATGQTQASGTIGDGQEIRIPLTEETASLDKGTVVREEVAVGKRPVQEIRDLSGDVRREELEVDDQTTTRKRAVNE
jgi:uncharacterized protein (TIGR02271 family)